MYVFRDGRRRIAGRELVRLLISSLRELPLGAAGDEVIPALIRTGELESALADCPDSSPQLLAAATAALDSIADSLISCNPLTDRERLIFALSGAEAPSLLWTSPLEGFAYYALHPMTYAALADSLLASGPIGVVGIRSIGCALSAVALAAARKRGVFAQRITVRPTGHPFDRRVTLSQSQQAWLSALRLPAAQFLICDEGPGLSGSSMLATGEALVEYGIESRQITFLCSRQADPETLRASNAAQRWRRFRSVIASGPPLPLDAAHWVGGGAWRDHPLMNGAATNGNAHAEVPPAWTVMERSKFISRDRRTLYKFEGFGHYGEGVRNNARLLAEHGFAPRVTSPRADRGFTPYDLVPARHATAANLSENVLLRLAEYCAFRGKNFPAPSANCEPEMTVAGMCAANAKLLFGVEADFTPHLPLERPVFSDSRMLPHEWLITHEGKLMKTDGASHGDDHFFPGPCDIVWDLAGAIVEWDLSHSASEFFCERYRQLTGDYPAARLPGYFLAYSLFRAGYCKMAAESLAGTDEHARLEAAYARYKGLAACQLKALQAARAA